MPKATNPWLSCRNYKNVDEEAVMVLALTEGKCHTAFLADVIRNASRVFKLENGDHGHCHALHCATRPARRIACLKQNGAN